MAKNAFVAEVTFNIGIKRSGGRAPALSRMYGYWSFKGAGTSYEQSTVSADSAGGRN